MSGAPDLIRRLEELSFRGEVEELRATLERAESRTLSPRDLHGPLASAASAGQLDAARCLLHHGADPDGTPGALPPLETEHHYWQTALVKAAWFRHAEVVQLLLETVRDQAAKDHALVAAAGRNDVQIAGLLLRGGARPDSTHTRIFTPLLRAAEAAHVDAALFLLDNGATPDFGETSIRWSENRFDDMNDGMTPLIAAVRSARVGRQRSVELVERLLRDGADPNRGSTQHGKTALMEAADQGLTDIVRLLIRNGADVDAVSVTWGTALIVACWAGRAAIVEILLQAGADPRRECKVDWALPRSAWQALEKFRAWDATVAPALPAIRALLLASPRLPANER